MEKILGFDYYYGTEAEQFSFVRVPKVMLKGKSFSGVSLGSKVLYGLLLDRMSLSMKNGWLDDKNRVYVIYTIKEIAEDLGCGIEKAVAALAELDSTKGIGLIEKVRRGQGKPTIIYVKNCIREIKTEENNTVKARAGAEFGKSEFKNSEKPNSRTRKSRNLELGKTESNNNNNNYTDVNYTNPNHTNPSEDDGEGLALPPEKKSGKKEDGTDRIRYTQKLREQVEYERLCEENPYYVKEMDEIIKLMTDVVCMHKGTVRINQEEYEQEEVKKVFSEFNYEHMKYVLEWQKNNHTEVRNMRNYILTVVYNTVTTYNNRILADVNYDMYSCLVPNPMRKKPLEE